MVKLEHLRHFVAVTETGSFTSAALKINISVSSIRNSIEKLETALSIVLFVRKPANGVALTDDGQTLLDFSKQLLSDVEDIEATFIGQNRKLKGNLTVGCQEGLTWSLVPRAIDLINRSHPDLKISMQTIWMETKFETLDRGEVDVLVTFILEKETPPKYDIMELCVPSACVMMRKGHPLDDGNPVRLENLYKYPHIFIKDGPALPLFYGMYRAVGLEPNIHMFSNISTGTQSVIGRSDAVSLRILRPAHDFTPLGDKMVVPPIVNDLPGPRLVAAINKRKKSFGLDKAVEFQKACQMLFETGEMKKHLYY